MDRELLEAYRRTVYYADTPGGRLALRIGQGNTQLELLLAEHGCRTWAYLTAFNPGSKRLTAEENQQRQACLDDALRAGGWTCFPGESVGADGDWPPELSTLVLGIDEAAAKRLGESLGQNAIVVGGMGKPPELLVLD
ncbi:MAG TPA: DUF3293 domain-containing protein [Pirellulales bacterium]|jgi:hypothetical protein|nr:DUF3293 domain-containing protein [Pirellulales bacterium]